MMFMRCPGAPLDDIKYERYNKKQNIMGFGVTVIILTKG
jgi:hypothetical protein